MKIFKNINEKLFHRIEGNLEISNSISGGITAAMVILGVICGIWGSNLYYYIVKNAIYERGGNEIIAEAILYLSCLAFIVMGWAILSARNIISRIIGSLFLGIGTGIVIKIALLFLGISNLSSP